MEAQKGDSHHFAASAQKGDSHLFIKKGSKKAKTVRLSLNEKLENVNCCLLCLAISGGLL
jgi:hypothetical protein